MDSGTGVFLRILRNSKNTFCYRTPLVAASACSRRKVAAVKIEKLKAFITKHYITILFIKTNNINLVTLNT